MEYKGTFLPHIHPKYSKFFITFNLYNNKIIKFYDNLKKQRTIELDKPKIKESVIYTANVKKKYFGIFDDFLNTLNSPENYLSNHNNAQIVVSKLEKYDKQYYNLLAYCIMPNHVHIIIDTTVQIPVNEDIAYEFVRVSKIMQYLKGGSAREINMQLKKTGQLWQRDYYDHFIRNQKEFDNIVNYIKQNPVKAGLVNKWTDWKYTFVSEECN